MNAPACAELPPELRELPAPAPRSHPRFRDVASSEDVRLFVRLVTRRDFPPAILDDVLLVSIMGHIAIFGIEEGARVFKQACGIRGLALIRAAGRNVDKLKAEGVDLWAA